MMTQDEWAAVVSRVVAPLKGRTITGKLMEEVARAVKHLSPVGINISVSSEHLGCVLEVWAFDNLGEVRIGDTLEIYLGKIASFMHFGEGKWQVADEAAALSAGWRAA
jgi:hypothetical protein